MAAFKIKDKKKKPSNTRITLDATHNNKLEDIKNIELKVTDLKEQNILFEKQISEITLDQNNNNNNKDKEIELGDKILENKKFIKKHTNIEINYFLDNKNILETYYYKTNEPVTNNNIKPKENSIINYFNTKNTQNTQNTFDKTDLFDEYLYNINNNYKNKSINKDTNVCDICNIERTLYLSIGKMICHKCGDESDILIESDKPSYKDPPREVTYFSYKRINHFNEWLAQFQAKETTDIPKDIYDEIIDEIKKERLDINKLSQSKLRSILKKIKKNKYYEHIPHILNKLNGINPPIMSPKIEEELRRMFKEIQLPFHKFCPKSRKNFLSYSYVLHKFVELLELDSFINCFILLKSREKLHQQDQIWKEICKFLDWEFIPSI
jgi:hypothetical protein